jgi:hypothetical protein
MTKTQQTTRYARIVQRLCLRFDGSISLEHISVRSRLEPVLQRLVAGPGYCTGLWSGLDHSHALIDR